jgi:hypothetical protein
MLGKESLVQQVVSSPSHVLAGSNTSGTANPNYLMFMNNTVISRSGAPLGVAVNPATGEIRTAYFNRSFRTVNLSQALWTP